MQKYGVAAALLGGLFLAPLPLMAQSTNVAYATGGAASEYVVFLDKGTSQLSAPAIGTIHSAAQAARPGTTIRLVGRADQAAAVKQELVREGISAASIVVIGTRSSDPLPRVADGLSDPASRRVEIKF